MIVKLVERDDSKKQVVISINGEITPMDTESFERNFKEIEPGIYEAGLEFVDMINHKLDDIQTIIPFLIAVNSENTPSAGRKLGEKVAWYAKKWNIDVKTASLEIASIFERVVTNMTALELVKRGEKKEG